MGIRHRHVSLWSSGGGGGWGGCLYATRYLMS